MVVIMVVGGRGCPARMLTTHLCVVRYVVESLRLLEEMIRVLTVPASHTVCTRMRHSVPVHTAASRHIFACHHTARKARAEREGSFRRGAAHRVDAEILYEREEQGGGAEEHKAAVRATGSRLMSRQSVVGGLTIIHGGMLTRANESSRRARSARSELEGTCCRRAASASAP
jgi:hypothetical protein